MPIEQFIICKDSSSNLDLLYEQTSDTFTFRGTGVANGSLSKLTRQDVRAMKRFLNDVEALFPTP